MPPPVAGEMTVEEILAQMEGAVPAAEPGTLKPRDILHRGDDELPAQMMAGALTSAGYSYIWDRVTGERSLTNNNMLPTQLRKKHPDGARVFTTMPPKDAAGNVIVPHRGTHKCLLHADSPSRAVYDAMGLPTCRKANLTSNFQVRLHMQHRHKMAWDAIEEERTRAEKDTDRAFQQQVIALAGRGAQEPVRATKAS
jgi:hypothetical protein